MHVTRARFAPTSQTDRTEHGIDRIYTFPSSHIESNDLNMTYYGPAISDFPPSSPPSFRPSRFGSRTHPKLRHPTSLLPPAPVPAQPCPGFRPSSVPSHHARPACPTQAQSPSTPAIIHSLYRLFTHSHFCSHFPTTNQSTRTSSYSPPWP